MIKGIGEIIVILVEIRNISVIMLLIQVIYINYILHKHKNYIILGKKIRRIKKYIGVGNQILL